MHPRAGQHNWMKGVWGSWGRGACTLAATLVALGSSHAAVMDSENEEDKDGTWDTLKSQLEECRRVCLAVLVATLIGIGVCMSLLLFFSWRCLRRRRRAQAFVVTDAGLSNVASRARKRLMDNASLMDTPQDKIPPTGRYEGCSTDIYQRKCITYCLTFHKNGLVSGKTSSDGRNFEIQGHLSKETGKYHWGETLQDAYYKNYEQPEVYSTALVNGRAVHLEVEAQVLDAKTGLLEAHYFDSADSNGYITLTFTEVFPSTIDVDIDENVEHRRLVT